MGKKKHPCVYCGLWLEGVAGRQQRAHWQTRKCLLQQLALQQVRQSHWHRTHSGIESGRTGRGERERERERGRAGGSVHVHAPTRRSPPRPRS
jgi:hypothetical protein